MSLIETQTWGPRVPIKLQTKFNEIHVDSIYGNDATGMADNLNKPFKTIAQAEATANPGDLIIVHPGNYYESNLGKDGVFYYFYEWAVVESLSGYVFSDSGKGPITVVIRGQGHFMHNTTTYGCFYISDATSYFDIEAYYVGGFNNQVIAIRDGHFRGKFRILYQSFQYMVYVHTAGTYDIHVEEWQGFSTSSTCSINNVNSGATIYQDGYQLTIRRALSFSESVYGIHLIWFCSTTVRSLLRIDECTQQPTSEGFTCAVANLVGGGNLIMYGDYTITKGSLIGFFNHVAFGLNKSKAHFEGNAYQNDPFATYPLIGVNGSDNELVIKNSYLAGIALGGTIYCGINYKFADANTGNLQIEDTVIVQLSQGVSTKVINLNTPGKVILNGVTIFVPGLAVPTLESIGAPVGGQNVKVLTKGICSNAPINAGVNNLVPSTTMLVDSTVEVLQSAIIS